MDFLIAASFADSPTRLAAPDHRAVNTSAFYLQTNPAYPGLKLKGIASPLGTPRSTGKIITRSARTSA